MEKLLKLIQKLGIELTADQTKQIKEVVGKEFVPAETAAADKTKLEELTKQLAARDKDLEKLKADNKSEELQKQLDELNAKYKQETEDLTAKLTAQESDFAAEKLFSGYKFASDRVRKSVLDEFKGKGFKLENGEFLGGNVIPEIDAYRYSTLYKLINAKGNVETYTPDKSTIISSLKADIGEVRDKCGSNTDLVIIMSIPIAEKLSDGEEFQRYINLTAFKQGEISTEIMTLNGIPIIRVPSARLKTAYTFNSGASSLPFTTVTRLILRNSSFPSCSLEYTPSRLSERKAPPRATGTPAACSF